MSPGELAEVAAAARGGLEVGESFVELAAFDEAAAEVVTQHRILVARCDGAPTADDGVLQSPLARSGQRFVHVARCRAAARGEDERLGSLERGKSCEGRVHGGR